MTGVVIASANAMGMSAVPWANRLFSFVYVKFSRIFYRWF
jgi:hypothetical protein